MSDPTPAYSKGGTHTHKPGCQCNPCKARARQQEALPVRLGADGISVIEASPESQDKVYADELIVASPGRAKRDPKAKRALIAEWIKLRTLEPDITNSEAARRMGYNRQYLQKVIHDAVNEGWLIFDDPLARIEHQVVPKALDNIIHFLDQQDKQVTIEVAKGTIFKSYAEAKGLNPQAHTVLALKIELPALGSAAPTEIIEGQIVGRPKVLIEASPEDAIQKDRP